MKSCVAFVGAILVTVTAHATSPPAPDTRPGPIGWEKRITPGFDPPIEYVIIYGASWIEAKRDPGLKPADCVPKWGPTAVPALVKLYRDPDWAAFQDNVLGIIGLYTTPEANQFLIAEITAARAGSTTAQADGAKVERSLAAIRRTDPKRAGEVDIQSRLARLLTMLRKMDPKRADQFVEEGLEDPDGPYFQTYVNDLWSRAQQADGADAKARLDKLLQTLPETNSLRKSIEQSQEANKAVQRAKEPMDLVLQKEKGGAR